MFSTDIAREIQQLVLLLPGFLLAITVHEAAHGYVAYKLGDPTAKLLGRLTLNPLKHLDLVGTLALVLTRMIGWAKPVPIDPRHFKDPMKGMALCSLAGPGANFALAVIMAIVLQLMPSPYEMTASRLGTQVWQPLFGIVFSALQINVVLGCFNLIPIPPLDGSKIVAWLMPRDMAERYLAFGRWGFLIVIVLVVSGLLGRILFPMVQFVFRILDSLIGLVF